METKQLSLELKVSAEGVFNGRLSSYGPPADLGGDIVMPGAFSKNLKEKGLVRPLLWAHETNNPIGSVELEDRADGLYVKGQLLMDLPEAQRVYKLIKSQIVKGLSIGYRVIREEMQKNGLRLLKEVTLYEASAVLFPMNEAAQISSVKSSDASAVRTALLEFRTDLLTTFTTKGRK